MAEMNGERDLFKRVIDIATLLVISSGLYFGYDQAVKLTDAIEVSTWSGISSQTIEVDKLLVEHPEIQQYFFGSKPIDKNDAKYPLVYAAAQTMLDYFDSVLTFIGNGKQESSRIERAPWLHYIEQVFRTSPLLCNIYAADKENQSKNTIAIADKGCAAQPR